MYRIYLVEDVGGIFPFLTDRDLAGMPKAPGAGPVELLATYRTRQEAWAHLIQMPSAWVASRTSSEV